jgi:hypothetical protein
LLGDRDEFGDLVEVLARRMASRFGGGDYLHCHGFKASGSFEQAARVTKELPKRLAACANVSPKGLIADEIAGRLKEQAAGVFGSELLFKRAL